MVLSEFDYESFRCGDSVHRFRQMRRIAFLLTVPILVSFALVSGEKAAAQYIPPANGPVCVETPGIPCPGSSSSSGSSTTSDPVAVWKERFHKMAEANKRRQAASDAKKKTAAEAKAKQKQAEIDAENLRAVALGQLQLAAETQRQATLEAARRQAAFDSLKPNAVGGLKGIDGAASATAPAVYASLKGLDSGNARQTEPAWVKTVTDPQVTPIAHRLASVVPPLPIPAAEVKLDWKKVYLNDDRLMNTLDMVVAGWEMTGVLGESISVPCKMLIIGGKTFIAGEDGAYAFLVKQDADYDAALAYLKDPAKAKEFAQLTQKLRLKEELPKNADAAMVRAAKAIVDPKLGNTGAMVWDAMTSKEALTAMVRKVALEAASEMTPSTEGLLKSEAERKAMFDAVRLERKRATVMLERTAVTEVQKEQLKTVIKQADKLSAEMYVVDKMENVVSGQVDDKISGAWDKVSESIADHFLGEAPKGREY
jgi:hypothetical protein